MRSKYGVDLSPAGIEARTADNIVFHSIKEKHRYLELKMLLRSGIIRDLELQKKYELRVNGMLICSWIADFVYRDLDERETVEDTKGVRTAEYRLKQKLFEALYGKRIIET